MTVLAAEVSSGATYAGGCGTYTVCGATGTATTAVLVVGVGGGGVTATGTGTPTTGFPHAAAPATTRAATRIPAAFMGITSSVSAFRSRAAGRKRTVSEESRSKRYAVGFTRSGGR